MCFVKFWQLNNIISYYWFLSTLIDWHLKQNLCFTVEQDKIRKRFLDCKIILMFNTVNSKKKFLWLSKTEKFIKVKSVLTIVKNALPMYNDIFLQVTALWDTIAEESLNIYYIMIMKNLESLQWDSLEVFKKDLEEFKQSLKKDIWNKIDKQDIENIEKELQDIWA